MINLSRFSVAECRRELAQNGVVVLDGFIGRSTLDQIMEEASRLAPLGFTSEREHDIYLDVPPAGWQKCPQRSAKTAVAFDQLSKHSVLRDLYESDELLEFLRQILSLDAIFRSCDPLDACELAYFGQGQELGWHFDESPFAVTLMLRPSERGGDFEFAPIARTHDEKEMTSARRVLTMRDGVRKIAQAPGALTVFSGRNALHRVAPVQGQSARINAVFTFSEAPGLRLTPATQELFYGRAV